MPRRTWISIFFVAAWSALCLIGLGWLAVNMGLQYPGQAGYRIQAQFVASNGLVNDADVRISGVKVGKVIALESGKDGTTIVTIRIDSDVRVRRDTRAVIRPKSLLGEKFVELVRKPASGEPYLQSGGLIPRAQTGSSVEIDDVLNNMDAPTRAAFSETLRQLGVGLDGRAGDVNESIPYLDQTAANLRPLARVGENRQKEIDRILTDVNIIMKALADEQDSLGRIVDSGDRTFAAIDERNQDLAGTIENLAIFFGSLDAAFADATPADRASLAQAPATIRDQRRMLSLTNPEVDKLFPELLLAQLNYPNNQLSVTDPQAAGLSSEWISAFLRTDEKGHLLRITNISNGPPPPPSPPGGAGAAQVPTSNQPAPPAGTGNIFDVFGAILGGRR
jgi:virulence factor Mce-like protein